MEFEFSNVRKCVIILFQYFEEAIHFCSNPHGYMEITENEGIAKNIVRAIYYLAFPSFLSYVLQCFKFRDMEWLFWEGVGAFLSIGWISCISYLIVDIVVNRIFRPRALFNYLVVMNFLIAVLTRSLDSIYLVTECIVIYYLSVLSVLVGVIAIIWYYLSIFYEYHVKKIFGVIGIVTCVSIFQSFGIFEELLMHVTSDIDIFKDKVACEYYDLVHEYVFLMPDVGTYCDDYLDVASYCTDINTGALVEDSCSADSSVGLYTVEELCKRFNMLKKKWDCEKEERNLKLSTEKAKLVSRIALMKFETNKSLLKQYYIMLDAMEDFFSEYDRVLHPSYNAQNCDIQNVSSDFADNGKKLTQLYKDVVDEYSVFCQLRTNYLKRLNWRVEHLFFYCPFATETMINEKVQRKPKGVN